MITASQMDKDTCVEIILPVRSELVEAGENRETDESGKAEDEEMNAGKAEDDGVDVMSVGQV